MTADEGLIGMSAAKVVSLLHREAISPLDLIDTLEQRIAAVEPVINALPTLCLERARDHARHLMERPADKRGPLAGLPVPIKDLRAVAGVRTTFGSTVFADFVPEESESLVLRIEANGGMVYAKSNTPEFGAGGHTFNDVFGTTTNPWNPSRSAGGSSGGAAAALASGTAWVAHGSDMAGSLRTPAAFCGVVGIRPGIGRVTSGPAPLPYGTLATDGPMARTVTDAALLLDAMVGWDAASPFATDTPSPRFLGAARRPRRPGRVAFSRDLGVTPVDPEIASVFDNAVATVAAAGVEMIEASPDFTGFDPAFHTLRAISYAAASGPLLAEHRDRIKPEVVWNAEKGFRLTAAEIIGAERERARLFHAVRRFMDEYDVLVCPAAIVAAFPATERYVKECSGQVFDTYIGWLAIAYALTLVSLPVIAIPCGVTSEGLPVGLQIAGRPGREAELIAIARFIEDAIGEWRPPDLPEYVVR